MTPRQHSQAGFTLIEATVAFLIVAVVGALTIGSFHRILPQVRADAGEQVLLTRLRLARNDAMTQRTDYTVQFTGTDTLQISHLVNGATTTETVTLPYSMQYMLFAGVPDTPDGFGNAAAIDLNNSTSTSLVFLGDGTVVDPAGNLLNGTIWIGIAGDSSTCGAVTVLGATGRIRGYRYDGTRFE